MNLNTFIKSMKNIRELPNFEHKSLQVSFLIKNEHIVLSSFNNKPINVEKAKHANLIVDKVPHESSWWITIAIILLKENEEIINFVDSNNNHVDSYILAQFVLNSGSEVNLTDEFIERSINLFDNREKFYGFDLEFGDNGYELELSDPLYFDIKIVMDY